MTIRLRRVAAVLLVAYLALLLYLTIFISFSFGPGKKLNLRPFEMMVQDIRTGGAGLIINFFGNIAVFAPLGVLLPVVFGRRWGLLRVTLAGMFLSLGIETTQWLCGFRVADIDDVILNTLGASIGYGVFAIGRKLLTSRRIEVAEPTSGSNNEGSQPGPP